MSFLEIILAIILPPLAVILRFGFGSKFFVNLILTLLGGIPGMIHAFYVMSQEGRKS